MVHFVGAGPGAEDLITVRGLRLLQEADVILYAGSLVSPKLLTNARAACVLCDTARMTLEEVLAVMEKAESEGKSTVRLHSGDPSLYGAVREQMDRLEERGIPYDVCPGVSALSGAAASMHLEYTLPAVSQSVIITRLAGRTPVPESESIESFAAHRASMVIFLSAGQTQELSARLIAGGYGEETPAALVYRATWPEEKVLLCTVGTLAETAIENRITRSALILVGEFLTHQHFKRSKLYDPAFSTGFRRAQREDPT